jgi:3'-phosphoadenosine 5'-phosphosulfate sulfotransferase (PAPS reductase)/FAD synthetase
MSQQALEEQTTMTQTHEDLTAETSIEATPVRHILSLSGGKDSTALAIYMRGRVAKMEYVFCDTGEELPETYEYLDKLEVFLGQPIVRLNPDRPFKHYLEIYRGVLPDTRTRWCTRMLKIKPFERYVGDDPVINYVGIRADENRKGYISSKSNIEARYPFVEDGIRKEDVKRILDENGLGLPQYYAWRSRSGCYFCFFQQRIEWVGLQENHPDLYEKATQFEKVDAITGRRYSWSQRESLIELMEPARMKQIKEENRIRLQEVQQHKPNLSLGEILDHDNDADYERPCLICTL